MKLEALLTEERALSALRMAEAAAKGEDSDAGSFLRGMRRWLKAGEPLRRSDLPLERRSPWRGGPESDSPELAMEAFMVRDVWIREFGFPVVIDETVEGLLLFGPFVEVGAGTGFLSRLLALRGADVVTTDAGTGTYGFRHGSWREVLIQDAVDAVLEHPGRTVLMSWPSLGEPWCEEAASAIRPGGLLIHIGERGGCTGTDAFEEILEADFEEVARVPMPVFCGIHDRVDVFRRKA